MGVAVANERMAMGRADVRSELVARGKAEVAAALASTREATAREAIERNMAENEARAANETINNGRRYVRNNYHLAMQATEAKTEAELNGIGNDRQMMVVRDVN